MERRQMLLKNLAVIGAILLLALATLALPRLLPGHDITPNAGSLEDAGFTFTPADAPVTPAE